MNRKYRRLIKTFFFARIFLYVQQDSRVVRSAMSTFFRRFYSLARSALAFWESAVVSRSPKQAKSELGWENENTKIRGKSLDTFLWAMPNSNCTHAENSSRHNQCLCTLFIKRAEFKLTRRHVWQFTRSLFLWTSLSTPCRRGNRASTDNFTPRHSFFGQWTDNHRKFIFLFSVAFRETFYRCNAKRSLGERRRKSH